MTFSATPGAWWSRHTLALAAALALHLALAGAQLAGGARWRASLLAQTVDGFGRGRGGIWIDSWAPMAEAEDYARTSPRDRLYREIFWRRGIKFLYPPTALPIIAATRQLAGRDFADWLRALRRVSWLMVALTGVAAAAISSRSARASGDPPAGRVDAALRSAIALALTITFYPIVKAYTLGQIQCWLNALFALLFWAWCSGRRTVAGVLAGVMCLVKPHYGVLMLWGVVRKQWRFSAALAATAAAGLVLSLALYRLGDHLDYLAVLGHISRHGEAYYPNQSINGLLHRLFENGDAAHWLPSAYPPFHAAVYAGTLALGLALITGALVLPARRPGASGPADLALIAVASTVASPIAWEHHHGILLPVLLWLSPQVKGRERWALALAYLLAAGYFAGAARVHGAPWNLVQSYLLAAAVIVLVLLYRCVDRGAGPALLAGVSADASRPLAAGRTAPS